MENEEQIAKWLAKPMWPWPIALAYAQADARSAALSNVVEILDGYPKLDGWDRFKAAGAVHGCFAAVTGGDWGTKIDYGKLSELEAKLVHLIESGTIKAWGREQPGARLTKIEKTDWVGAEIDADDTCDLVKAGWRNKAKSLKAALGEVTRTVWCYDVHLPRNAMLAAFPPREDWDRHVSDDLLGDPLKLDCLIAESRAPREGYWTPFSALAWVASRDDRYVAAVQSYEEANHANRGGPHSCAAWIVIGDDAGARFGTNLTDATAVFREKLEDAQIPGAIATNIRSGATRAIEPFEWTNWSHTFELQGLALIPGYVDFKFRAKEVRAAFPAPHYLALDIPPHASEVSVEDWAADAAQRGVTISEAATDARKCLGDTRPTQDDCRAALRSALTAIGRTPKAGRPKGSKSWAKANA